MLPKQHLIIAIFFSVFLFLFKISFFGIFFFIFASVFLIDFDHLFYFYYKTKSLNLKYFWEWSMERKQKWENFSKKEKQKYKLPIFIFHGIEFLLLFFILSFFNEIFFLMFLGIVLHLITDFIDLQKKKTPLYSKISPLIVFYKNKDKKEFN